MDAIIPQMLGLRTCCRVGLLLEVVDSFLVLLSELVMHVCAFLCYSKRANIGFDILVQVLVENDCASSNLILKSENILCSSSIYIFIMRMGIKP